jgi:hypothetical protein
VTVPQYTSTTDPEVIAAIERNRQIGLAFHKSALAFAAKYGNPDHPAYYGGREAESWYSVSSIKCPNKPTTGRWTRGWRGQGWRPFKNTVEDHQMADIARQTESIPGVPERIDGPHEEDGRHWHLYPRPFVHDGVAWLGFSMCPNLASDETLGEQWSECLGSQLHAAHEAVTGERAST